MPVKFVRYRLFNQEIYLWHVVFIFNYFQVDDTYATEVVYWSHKLHYKDLQTFPHYKSFVTQNAVFQIIVGWSRLNL